MDREKDKLPGQKHIWLIQIVFAVCRSCFDILGYVSIIPAIFLFFVLAVNSVVFAFLFSGFKKGLNFYKRRNRTEIKKNRRTLTRSPANWSKRDWKSPMPTKRLAELDVAKSDFVSVAATNLRTPLTGIKWSLPRFLTRIPEPLNPDQKEIAEKRTCVNQQYS